MIAKVLSSYNSVAYFECIDVLKRNGIEIWTPAHFYYDIIICPDYDKLIPDAELRSAEFGALVFHPSPLPRMRGRSAIKRQYKAGDNIGGGTWFWADSSIDGGDICEQEVVVMDRSVRPRDYYNDTIIPLMCRTLDRAVEGILISSPRVVPQVTGRSNG